MEGFNFLMVELMGSLYLENVEDFAEEQYASLAKRARLVAAPLNQVYFFLFFLEMFWFNF